MASRLLASLRSTTLRFVVLFFACQVLLTGGALLFIAKASEAALEREQQGALGELRDGLLESFRAGGQPALARQIGLELEAVQPETLVLLLARADGAIVAGNLGAWPAPAPKAAGWRIIYLYRTGATRPEPMGIIATQLGDGSHLLTGHVLTGRLQMLTIYRQAVAWILLAAMIPALVLAALLARMIDRKVAAIAVTAEQVGSGALSQRVPVDGSGDSFDTLGQGVNRMLERIERLVGELRIVTDGLAHDLRSPITRLKSRIEQATLDVRDPQALATLEGVGKEADSLLAMLTTALQISRAEAGIGAASFGEVDVGLLLADLDEIYGPIAEDAGMTIAGSAATPLTARLHRELVSQALGNLIENAVKYAAGGSRIALEAERRDGALIIAVADDGPGIPEHLRAEALRKFGRLDPARSAGGAGLGLSLVEAVARLHGGSIALDDNRPGLRVTLRLPI